MRVLLVEDEPDLGAAIKRTLNQESMWLTGFWTALKLGSIENQWTQYTLAIFDWLLPGFPD